jgi:acetate---CoA ligase (ADP-forming)
VAQEFGALTPLLAPRSVAVIGASDRTGNLGGLAVQFLQKFGYQGAIWPVNAGRTSVAGLPCFADLASLPEVPDMAILAVPAESVEDVVAMSIAAGVPSAVVWAGGFAEGDEKGRARQRRLEALCRSSSLKLCGPNCIGVINTAIGLTASFSSLMAEIDRFTPGRVSMVSQSGGIAVNAHARAQDLGLGFRVTVSCGNEAVLGIPDFMQALLHDDLTRVIAVYAEAMPNPDGFVSALAEARRRRKPVVVLKGGASQQSARAALAHTGRLAGSDRTYDAIFREFAAIRVYSPEEMLEVALQLASLPEGCLPCGNRVLISTFGGGSGVIATDQCARDGMTVPLLDDATRARLTPILTPLASSMNPVDLTPGSMTNPKNRETLPQVLELLAEAPGIDQYLCFASGFGALAPAFADMFLSVRQRATRPIGISWLAPPDGIVPRLAANGMMVFQEHARLIRTAGHLVRYAADLRHRIRTVPRSNTAFPWDRHVSASGVITEDVVAGILTAAGLPVAPGRMARAADEAIAAAAEVGFKVAMKGISPTITHRAAAGLVALDVATPDAVAQTFATFQARAQELGAALDGVWVQHMFQGHAELLATAFRDEEFGVIVGCGIGGGATEIIDDVVFARAPIDSMGASDLLRRLRTLQRLPAHLSADQQQRSADFIAGFSALAASAPWPRFTMEVNPLKIDVGAVAAVDGLLVIEHAEHRAEKGAA